MADELFAGRSRDSQIVSIVSRQGEELTDPQGLVDAYEKFDGSHQGRQLKRPAEWGGYAISPVRMEFLEFKDSRFHERTLFEMHDGSWAFKRLQP